MQRTLADFIFAGSNGTRRQRHQGSVFLHRPTLRPIFFACCLKLFRRSHALVGTVRHELESTCQIVKSKSRQGADGKVMASQ
jgi:hypothetical protein